MAREGSGGLVGAAMVLAMKNPLKAIMGETECIAMCVPLNWITP